MPTSVSLRDVAEKAGVSRSTASRALQHHPMVALKTRERVEAAAAELGYQPDQVVSGLMRRHRHNREMTPQHTRIAWINYHKEEHSWHTVPYHIQARQGAQRRAEALNIEVEDIWLGQPGMKVPRLEQILYSRGIQGAILPSPNLPVEDYGFQLDHLALVVMGGHPQHRGRLTQILPDEFGNMTAAMTVLRERGYERMAFCTNGFINWASEFRLEAAYRQAQQDLKTKNRLPVFTFDGKQDRVTLLDRMEKHKPDALITIWGETVEWLEDAGYDVPGDIGVVTLNLTEHTPGWTGIRQNQPAMASAAIDAVLAQLARFETGYTDNAKRMLIDGDWVDGNTTR